MAGLFEDFLRLAQGLIHRLLIHFLVLKNRTDRDKRVPSPCRIRRSRGYRLPCKVWQLVDIHHANREIKKFFSSANSAIFWGLSAG